MLHSLNYDCWLLVIALQYTKLTKEEEKEKNSKVIEKLSLLSINI